MKAEVSSAEARMRRLVHLEEFVIFGMLGSNLSKEQCDQRKRQDILLAEA
jgi:hypothetical protein